MSNIKNLLILLLCFVLLIALLVCTIPVPGRINETFCGYSVNANGEVSDDITVSITGKSRNYLFVTDELFVDMTISFASGSTLKAESAGPFLQLSDQIIVCQLNYIVGEDNTLDGGYMAFSADQSSIILDGVTDGTYYAASENENTDAAGLVARFSDFISHN